ncbi:MAG: rod shape-determining protein MreD [Bacteroidia bacterium]|nr:rod shape-determining protein MreD [Bacteroidia bacterium]
MISEITGIIFRFAALVILQVLLLDNIELSGYINPYLYILFLILLPVETAGWLVLILGFVLGLTIDLFGHTPGMHTAACVFAAFTRKFLLKYMEPRDGYSNVFTADLKTMGVRWFTVFALVFTLTHHIFLFYAESFRLSSFFLTLFRALLSSVFTVALILFTQFLSTRSRER